MPQSSQPQKIILLNGPPRSGKDTMAELIATQKYFCKVEKFAKPIKLAVAAIFFGGDYERFAFFDTAEMKDVPHEVFLGKTCREVQIAVSESFLKPFYQDKHVFGKLLVSRLTQGGPPTVLVSDSGFREEAEELVNKFGADKIKLVRIKREGYTYAGDSRSYIDLSDLGVDTLEVENVDGDQSIALQQIIKFIDKE